MGGSGTGRGKTGRELVLPSRPQMRATGCLYRIGPTDEPAIEKTDACCFCSPEKAAPDSFLVPTELAFVLQDSGS